MKIAQTVKNWFTDSDREKVTSPQTQMAVALNLTGHPTYEGTVPAVTVARRRAKNKRARQARAVHRRAAPPMNTRPKTPRRVCTVCGHGRRIFDRVLLGTMLPCLNDANDQHHAGCRDGCDGCVAWVRMGVRS